MSEDQQMRTAPTQARSSSLGIPIAIVIAAGLIAAAIVFTGSQKSSPLPTGVNQGVTQETPEIEVAPVTADDHILGNPNAPIMIIEYSDFDCPFCKNFHDTMHQIMAEFGPSGQVAWVYRHFPLAQLHPNASKISEGSECVAELGGNDAFWTFTDLIFNERGTNEPTNMLRLPEFATQAGVDAAAYTECVNSGRYTAKIAADVEAAIRAGARGTPYSMLVVGGEQGVINGAQPYATVRQMIQTVLNQM